MRQRFANAVRISASHKNVMFKLGLLFEACELCRSNRFAVGGFFLKWSLMLAGKLLNKIWYLGVFGWKVSSSDFGISSLWVKLSASVCIRWVNARCVCSGRPNPRPIRTICFVGAGQGRLSPHHFRSRIEKPRFNLSRAFVPFGNIFDRLTKRHVIALNYRKTWLHRESQCVKCDVIRQDVTWLSTARTSQ